MDLGILSSGETPSAQEQTDAFSALNDLLDSWSTQNLLIPAKLREVFPLVSGQQTYTMGVGGNFNTSRPQMIENALIVAQTIPETELPIKIINQDQFAGIIVKSTTSSLPLYLYNDNAFPMANLSLWPVPNINTQLILYSWKPLIDFATVNTVLTLPPGYARALRYNLEVELAPQFGVQLSENIIALAVESKEDIKRMNKKPLYLGMDGALLERNVAFNWLTGDTV